MYTPESVKENESTSNFMVLSYTNRSPYPYQKNNPKFDQQEENKFSSLDYAVPADHKLKIKKRKIWTYALTLPG